jgi:hypothetical protein
MTAVLRALTVAALLWLPLILGRQAGAAMLVGLFLMMGALATGMRAEAVYLAEVWAGVLIALSLCAYHQRYWIAAASLAVIALFFRELVAPYCLVCGLLSLRARRWRESAVWIAGGLLYTAYFVAHALAVRAHTLPTDIAHHESWLRWNGLQFVLSTLQMNGWLQRTPSWVDAAFLVTALAGALWSAAPLQLRLSLLVYAALFSIAGLSFNYYWGLMTTPIWALAAAHGIAAWPPLARAAAGSEISSRHAPAHSEISPQK